MGRSKRSRVYHLYIAYMRAACVCVQVESQEVSVHLPKNLSKGATATPLDTATRSSLRRSAWMTKKVCA